jgi:hypothetical protein
VAQDLLHAVCLFARAGLLAPLRCGKFSLVFGYRLIVTVLPLWLESSMLASMMAIAVVLPELAWNVDFFLV